MRLPNATDEWEWWSLSSNVPIGDIRLHPDLPWDREGLSKNKDITVVGMNHLNQVMTNAVGEWGWWSLSMVIPIGDIRLHPDLPWNREGLSWNKDITVEAIHHLNQVMTNAVGEWDWRLLSSKVPIDDIRLHPDLPWDRYGLSQNKEMTLALIDEVLTNAVGEWEWWSLSSNVPIGDIRLHPDLPWDRYGLSQSKDITVALMDELDEVLTNAVGEWEWWEWWSLSSKVPMDEIRARPDLPWDPDGLALNPGVTVDDAIHMDIGDRIEQAVSMDEIKANPLWPWNRRAMSMNPSISMEMVMANPDD